MNREVPVLTRRQAIAAAGLGVLGLRASPAVAKATLGEDGLYQMDWYLESFLDLAEDLTGATASGKRFAILWGLKGCPACKRMHEVHLMDPGIERYIRDHFEILHLNHIGARTVTDFDGRKLSEKALGERYAIRFTPAIQFFPEATDWPCRAERAGEGSCPHAGVARTDGISRDVSLCARERLRDDAVSRLAEEAGLRRRLAWRVDVSACRRKRVKQEWRASVLIRSEAIML